jgi:hypothetical protein
LMLLYLMLTAHIDSHTMKATAAVAEDSSHK